MNVSVVIPTFNSAVFLAPTLKSVLRQTLQPMEILVVDDGSSDETVAVAERTLGGSVVHWSVLRCAHAGPGATRNAGIKAAKGQWIAFLDSDDLWLETKLERVAEAQRGHPDANFFCHAEEHRHLDGSSSITDYGNWYRADAPLTRQLFKRNLFSTSAVVCRRELLVQHGGFDSTLPSGQDYELWLRLAPALRVAFIREVQGCYVDRAGNITSRSAWSRLWQRLRILTRHKEQVGCTLYASAVTITTLATLRGQARELAWWRKFVSL